jgi:hypothetical protein
MVFLCARQAWHDAFASKYKSSSYTLTTTSGVRDVGMGVVDSCERGFVISAVHKLRDKDYLAYCWGMAAYAPANTVTLNEMAAMYGFMRSAFFDAQKKTKGREKYSPLFEHRLKLLCRLALMDAGLEDARQGLDGDTLKVARRMKGDIASLLGLTLEQYKATGWHEHYIDLKKILTASLPERALAPVAAVVAKQKQRNELERQAKEAHA